MAVITLHQFNTLRDKDKLTMIQEHGVVIAHRFTGKFHVYLHQLFSFYVELHYRLRKTDVVEIRAFSSTDMLEPYLKNIKLDDLNM